MITAAKAAANAANAQHSTGPRTEPGKARSAQNARKHGLTARELVVAPEERGDFESLRESLLAELAPLGVLEVLTFNQLLHAAWNLRRCRRLEADLAVNGPDPLIDESAARSVDRLSLYAARAERAYYRAIRELRALQTNRVLIALELPSNVRALVPPLVCIDKLTKRTHAGIAWKPEPAPKPPLSTAAACSSGENAIQHVAS
jgi:hypothetical protein